jgi:hypothetical protein
MLGAATAMAMCAATVAARLGRTTAPQCPNPLMEKTVNGIIFKQTMELRYVIEWASDEHTERVLQQRWVGVDDGEQVEEWREIPVWKTDYRSGNLIPP